MTRATSGRKEPRANVRGVSTRARLLDAALSSFSDRGFHGTSTRDIAEAAGMSPAALYAHYPTKEELLFKLSLEGHRDVREVVLGASAGSTNPTEQLRAIAFDFSAWHARFHTQARVVQYEMAALTPDHAAVIATIRRETQACVRGVILGGLEAGAFAVADPSTAARAILSLGIDVARWYDPAGPLNPEGIGQQYSELALRMVQAGTKGPASPPRRRVRGGG